MLLTAVISHGYSPYDLLVGTLISLPKDKHGNLCSSDNYRGICLCCCITKILEWCLLLRYQDKLATSGLQFAFKSGHSTTMCSLALKDVVHYYWNRNSNVHCALIDASKAFDRVRYDRLFELLYSRGLPPIMIRILLDMYQRQMSRAAWDGEYDQYFTCVNGVRQGGVISPLMFTVYVDELISKLKSSGIGCHIGHIYLGCLGYADDLKLLCPGLKGLQKMLKICEDFGEKFSVKFNALKSMCITFDRARDKSNYFNENIVMCLNGSQLKWVNVVKDLGNYIKYNLSESEEIRHKRADFTWRANGILVKYRDTIPEVKMHLVNSYCCHLYGCQAWCFSDKHVELICTAWNKTIRRIWNLPYDSHRIYLCALNGGQHIRDYLYRRFCAMYDCMASSDNKILSFLIDMSKNDCRSILARNVNKICKDWRVNEQTLWKIWRSKEISIFKKDEIEDSMKIVGMIRELAMGVVGFDNDEIADILMQITTN